MDFLGGAWVDLCYAMCLCAVRYEASRSAPTNFLVEKTNLPTLSAYHHNHQHYFQTQKEMAPARRRKTQEPKGKKIEGETVPLPLLRIDP